MNNYECPLIMHFLCISFFKWSADCAINGDAD
jgi:hypothetical protein